MKRNHSNYCVDCKGECLRNHLPIEGGAPNSREVTPSQRVFNGTIGGKHLTDRRITQLQKRGYFGSGILSIERLKQTKKKSKRGRSISLADFLKAK